MASTPPPPTRVRTPSTPLHGPKYDTYEPYSPRRSSRISSKPVQPYPLGGSKSVPGLHHQSRTDPFMISSHPSRKTPSKKASFKRTSSQTFSPPSSPVEPERMQSSPRHARTLGHNRKVDANTTLDTDSDFEMNSRMQPFYSRKVGQHGIPTPAKTPRKRTVYDEVQLTSTARVLFPARSAHTDDIMPSPRKARKHKHAALALDSFDSDLGGDEFHIYTDSKERIPEVDESEDNPFLSRKSSRKSQQQPVSRPRKGAKHGMTKEIDEAVESGKGMVYVFRGKKFFRPFTDDEIANGQDDELGTASDAELRRQAGSVVQKSLLRRSNPRRKLFQSDEASHNVEDVDEDAVTDIEADEANSSLRPQVRTPTKHSFAPATPPATGHKTRTVQIDNDELQTHSSPMWLDGANDPSPRRQGTSLFDTWQRTKPSTGKRVREAGEKAVERPTGGASIGKRSKSGQHAS